MSNHSKPSPLRSFPSRRLSDIHDAIGLPLVENITLDKQLGETGTARIYAGETTNKGSVAVRISRPSMDEGASDDVASRYAITCATASMLCRNVARPVGITEINGSPALVMRKYDGSLQDLLDKSTTRLPPGRALRLLEELAMGLRDLHEAQCVHRNFKPKKVLLDGDHPAISMDDQSILESSSSDQQQSATLSYAAPEQFDSDAFGAIGPAADIYAFGIMCCEVLGGELPTRHLSSVQLIRRVMAKEEIAPPSTITDPVLFDLVKRMVAFNQVERPSADEVLRVLRTKLREREEAKLAAGIA